MIWYAFGLAEASQATAFDDDVIACWVTLAALRVTTPELFPSIQVVVVEPSLPAIYNVLFPVAEATSTSPIIILPEPSVRLSAALWPIRIL